MKSPLLVAAAAIENEQGQVLIAKRPDQVDQGGLWEFPGGKLAPFETGLQALKRELHEELGIDVMKARPLIRVQHRYPEMKVLLDVWKVTAFSGEAWGKEGQPVRWVDVARLPSYNFPAANEAIIKAIRLPDSYVITDGCKDQQKSIKRLTACLNRGYKLIQLRAPDLDAESYRCLAQRFQEVCDQAGAELILNADPELLKQVKAAGVHLNARRLAEVKQRPLAKDLWVAASCHTAKELKLAQTKGVDFVTLSPVQPTPTHPGAATLNWQGFKELVEYEAALPVYALGGLQPEDRSRVFALGGQGVAGISHFW